MDTTGLDMSTMARGQLMTPLPLDPMLTLMLMPGTDMVATTDMDTGLMDTDTGTPTDTDTTTARGQLMRLLLLDLTPTLMLTLIPGTDITATATPTTDMATPTAMDTGDTTERNK